MKIKFTVKLLDRIYEETLDIDENKLIGEGYQPRNVINNMLSTWTEEKTVSYYQILDDERFNEEEENMPYVDWVTKKRLGWNNETK